MGTKLYVGNLKYDVGNAELSQMFEGHGTVENASVISDRETGRSRGFGFVAMSSEDEAQAAISELDGQDVDGRNLRVNIARPKEDRARRY